MMLPPLALVARQSFELYRSPKRIIFEYSRGGIVVASMDSENKLGHVSGLLSGR